MAIDRRMPRRSVDDVNDDERAENVALLNNRDGTNEVFVNEEEIFDETQPLAGKGKGRSLGK